MKRKIYYVIFTIIMFLSLNINVKAYSYKTSDVPNNSYVIGTHLFTRKDLNDNYNGTLKTEHIMFASKSIMSDSFNDMIIYSKAPDGLWFNELTGQQVEMDDEINIEYKNTIPYLLKPIISYGEYSGSNVNYINYNNGEFSYNIAVENWEEYITSEDELQNYRFEVYELVAGEYVPMGNSIIGGLIGEPVVVKIEAGTSKEFAVRVYTTNDDGTKNYSEYSDTCVIDKTKIEKPELKIGIKYYDETNHKYIFEINTSNWGEIIDKDNFGNPVTTTTKINFTNYELYEKNENDNKFLREQSVDLPFVVDVNVGETKTLIAKSFVLNVEGNKVLSDFSEELILDGTLENRKPNIVENFVEYNNGNYIYNIKLNNACDFLANGGTGECSNPIVTNMELYKKENNQFVRVDGISWEQEDNAISYKVPFGQKVELAVRMYAINNQGERKFTDYSNVITIDKTNIQLDKPSIDVQDIQLDSEGVFGKIVLTNLNAYTTNGNSNISGIEIYSSTDDENMSDTITVNGQRYYKLSERNIEYYGFMPTTYPESETVYKQIVRVFIEKSDGTRIYSEFSEPVGVTIDRNQNIMVTTNVKPEKPNLEYFVKRVTSNDNLPDSYECENQNIECVYTYQRLDGNQYKNNNGYYTINGVEFYEKGEIENVTPVIINGEKYINTDSLSYQNVLDFSKPIDFPDVLPMTYAVRTYVLNTNGEKIYSDPTIITINSYEEYSKSVYDDTLRKTIGQLAYTVTDINHDGKLELLLRGPFSTSGTGISYKIVNYNENTFIDESYAINLFIQDINLQNDKDISIFALDNYGYDVYQNNDNSLLFVSSFGTTDGLNQFTNKVSYLGKSSMGYDTIEETISETIINKNEDLITGDKLLTFYPLSDKTYLENVIKDSNVLNTYKKYIDEYYNNTGYAYTDINGDGIQELILKKIMGKDMNIFYEIYTYKFDNDYILNRFYSVNKNDNIWVGGDYEHYLYQNDTNTLMVTYKYLYQEKEVIRNYGLNDINFAEINSEERDIVNGEMSTGDHLITFYKYTNEDKGC